MIPVWNLPDTQCDIEVVSLQERPDLQDAATAFDTLHLPPFLVENDLYKIYAPRLMDQSLRQFQLLALYRFGADKESIVGTAKSVPLCGVHPDQLEDTLPHGYGDDPLAWGIQATDAFNGFDDWRDIARVSCALTVAVTPQLRQSGLGSSLLTSLKTVARSAGFEMLVAPVRPMLQTLYPLQSFEAYCQWQNAQSLPFDPWIRTHVALGGSVVEGHSYMATFYGNIEEWQRWSGLSFPKSGDYWIPGGMAPVKINVEKGRGRYDEPRLWIAHPLPKTSQPKPTAVQLRYRGNGSNRWRKPPMSTASLLCRLPRM